MASEHRDPELFSGYDSGHEENPLYAVLRSALAQVLQNADIQSAVQQAETSERELGELVVTHAEELVRSFPEDELTYSQKIGLIEFESTIALRWFVGVFLVLLSAWIAEDMVSWTESAWLLMFVNFGLAVFCSVFLLLPLMVTVADTAGPVRPTPETLDRLADAVIGPFVREHLNRVIDDGDHQSVMRVTSAPGLAEPGNLERMVRTEALSGLGNVVQSITSGSIGVSGPRGAGKTTLLQYFSDPSFAAESGVQGWSAGRPDLRFMVSAPVTYQQRDFILHIFGMLCREVIRFEEARRGARETDNAGRRFRGSLRAVIVAGAAGSLFGIPAGDWPRFLGSLQIWMAVASSLAVIAVAGMLASWWPRRKQASPDQGAGILSEARNWQEKLRYVHSFTAGSSGSLGLPRAVQVGISSSHQAAESPLTVPELVAEMRDFAARVMRKRQADFADRWNPSDSAVGSRDLGSSRLVRIQGPVAADANENSPLPRALGAKPRMVIGIDEIDKMDAESAQRFLNEIKSIFGMPGCLYLVSVSDEALDIYEKRVLLGRTSFDSAFDEVYRVSLMNYSSCKLLLRQRIAGIPGPVIGFCYVMSGGVPRDAIRAARAVINAAHDDRRISSIVLRLVQVELGVIRDSCIAGIAASATNVNEFPSVLMRPEWPGRTVEEMIASLEDPDAARVLQFKFRAAFYFYATVAEVFTGGLLKPAELLRADESTDDHLLDDLAAARNAISVNPAGAWQKISQFRNAVGLNELRDSVTSLSPRRGIRGARFSRRG